MAPTILDLAGVKVPADIQGMSIRPLLMGGKTDWRKEFYYHYYGVGPMKNNWIGEHGLFGISTKTEKLVCYPDLKGRTFWEYFDLAVDPLEMRNLYGDPACKEKAAAMEIRLRAAAEQYKDTKTVRMMDEGQRAE
mgnify:FL=1